MKIKMKNLVSFILLIIIAAAAIWYVEKHIEDFKIIKTISFAKIGLLLLLSLLYYICQGVILKFSLESYNLNLKFHQYFGLTMVTLFGNTFIPYTGLGFRAGYLKYKCLLKYADFISSTGAIYIVKFFVYTAAAIVGMGYLYFRENVFNTMLFGFFTMVLAACIVPLIFHIPIPETKSRNKYISGILSMYSGWKKISGNYKIIICLFLANIFELIIYSGMFYISYEAIGSSGMPFIYTFIPASLSLFGFVFRITPASLGIYEGTIMYSSQVLKFTLPQGLLVAGILRVSCLIWILTLGPVFFFLLTKGEKIPEENFES